MSEEKLKQEGQRIQNSVVTPELLNHNADNYFTDGSVCQETGQAGASAVWVNDKDCVPGPIVLQAKITSKVGSMLAELKAIEMALGHCQNNPVARDKINIFTDSLCALQVLQKLPPPDNVELINKILNLIQALKHHDIHFHWIPSHAGIYYNEIADHMLVYTITK